MFDDLTNTSPPHLTETDLNTVTGIKRRAPSLLPAFEPSSSPPRYKRQKSRLPPSSPQNDPENLYPPSSALPSSPPVIPASGARPTLKRTMSTLSERAPLTTVPSITLPANGEEILLGRSSKSCQVGLSANRLISRVHIKARYIEAGEQGGKRRVEVVCTGWNGVTIHCQGQAWDLMRGDVFNSETEGAEVMLDIQDSRVLLAWPGQKEGGKSGIEGKVGQENVIPPSSPPKVRIERSKSPEGDENARPVQPQQMRRRILEPVSPTPVARSRNPPIYGATKIHNDESLNETFLEIYEDEADRRPLTSNSTKTIPSSPSPPVPSSPAADHSDNEVSEASDDENEPSLPPAPVFSFNIDRARSPSSSSRFKDSGFESSFASDAILPPMGRFSTAPPSSSILSSPPPRSYRARSRSARTPSPYREPPSTPPHRSRSPSLTPTRHHTLLNHLSNQLAFSRIATVPLSELVRHLPENLKHDISKERVVEVLENCEWVGEVKRHGKDAAGKRLESEFYYVLEKDVDEERRRVVGGGNGRRAVRRTRLEHKQYYWKKPKVKATHH